jgi:alpha-D-xyloside xylohydrolase
MTLDGPMLTLVFTTPAPDVLALCVTHYKGVMKKAPCFDLARVKTRLLVTDTRESVMIVSGKLCAVVRKDPFRLDYYYDGEH